MTARLLLSGLAAWWLQFAALVLTVALVVRATRFTAPRALVPLWGGVLLGGLALPVVQAAWPSGGPRNSTMAIDVAFTRAAESAGADPAPAVLGLLAAVAGLRILRLARGVRRLRRWAAAGRPHEEGLEMAGAASLADLRLCDEVDAPATFGWRRPVVLLPARFPAEPPERRRHALLHELSHVRRGDWVRALAEELAAEALWFQPAVRWVVRELRVAQEQVVDAEVVAATGDRRGYAEALVAMASARQRPLAAGMSTSSLERRMDFLMKEDVMSKTRIVSAVTTTTLAAVLVAAGMARAVPLPTGGGEGSPAKSGKTAERKVLHKVNPTYPAEAKAKAVEGIVELDVLVTAAGAVTDVKVLRGPAELTEAAIAAVRQWRYAPLDAATRMTLTIRFTLAPKKDAPPA